jgi:putative membrane protein
MVVGVLRRLLWDWAIAAVAVGLTAGLLSGVHIDGGFGALLVIALVWGLVNAIIGPIARLLSLPLTLITFGLFALVVNGLLFLLTSALASRLHVDNFGWAVLGAIVISIVTMVLEGVERRVVRRNERRSNRRAGAHG